MESTQDTSKPVQNRFKKLAVDDPETFKVTIEPELKELILPLTGKEAEQLEENMLSEGCLDPLIVWIRGEEYTLIDGHNRYEICKMHNLPFEVSLKEFNDIDEVKQFMINHQIGRRNLTRQMFDYLTGYQYEQLKKKESNSENLKQNQKEDEGSEEIKMTSSASTAEKIARESGTSETKVKRNAAYFKGIEKLKTSNPELKSELLRGNIKVSKRDVIEIGRNWKSDPSIKLETKEDIIKLATSLKKPEAEINSSQTKETEKTASHQHGSIPMTVSTQDSAHEQQEKLNGFVESHESSEHTETDKQRKSENFKSEVTIPKFSKTMDAFKLIDYILLVNNHRPGWQDEIKNVESFFKELENKVNEIESSKENHAVISQTNGTLAQETQSMEENIDQ